MYMGHVTSPVEPTDTYGLKYMPMENGTTQMQPAPVMSLEASTVGTQVRGLLKASMQNCLSKSFFSFFLLLKTKAELWKILASAIFEKLI